MIKAWAIILMTLAAFLPHGAVGQSKVVVCYYANWSQYRNGLARFTPANVDPNLCTHIMFAFAKIVNKQLRTVEANDLVRYRELVMLKRQNPNLKIVLSVGGYNHPASEFSAVVANEASTRIFADDAVRWLRSNELDGLDIDWEYPGSRGSAPEDKQRYTLFLQRLHKAFEDEAVLTGRARLLLTAAVPAGEYYINRGFEINKIHPYLDFVSMMGYDYHGTWESTIDHHSPLYPRPDQTGFRRNLNEDWSIRKWADEGVPRNKLVLGMPTYGRGFRISSTGATTPGSPYISASLGGPNLYTSGLLAYFEICQLMQGAGWRRVPIPETGVSYSVGPDGSSSNTLTWVGHDDVNSMRTKAQYILDQGLAGATFWDLAFDDFTGTFCGEGRYPLISAVRTVLEGTSVTTAATPPPAPTTPATTVPTPATTVPTPATTAPTPATTTPTPATTTPRTAPATQAPAPTTQATAATTNPTGPATQPTVAPTDATTVRTAPTTNPTTQVPATPPNPDSNTCSVPGLFPDPQDCSRFYFCVHNRKMYIRCPFSLVFDPKLKVCNWSYNVPGC